LGAPGRAVIGRAGKAQTAAMAGAMARICNATPEPEGGSTGCAALTRAVNRLRSKNQWNNNTLRSAKSGQLPDLLSRH
jgi:hypothetical protein